MSQALAHTIPVLEGADEMLTTGAPNETDLRTHLIELDDLRLGPDAKDGGLGTSAGRLRRRCGLSGAA